MAQTILEHRLLSKLQSTYIEALPKLVNKQTGRIHTNFNQFITATGRLSSSNPNLQNIPIKSSVGKKIRETFIAEEGNALLSLDYSQIEIRILAHLSQDKVVLDAFNNKEDVHLRTASEIFDTPLPQVTKEQRTYAKTINFGLLYGMGARKLSQTLAISQKEAKEYLDKYYSRYAGIYAWQENLLKKARKEKEVRTLFGRRRKLPYIDSKNQLLVKRSERIAINTAIQGTAADIIKKAMIEVEKNIKEKMPTVKLLLQVHDELVLEAPENQAKQVYEIVSDIMCNAVKLSVPIVVDGGIANSWAQAH